MSEYDWREEKAEPEVHMMTTPQPNGLHSEDDIDADRAVPPPIARSNTKTLRHQVVEIHRLVDNAMENLDQVRRALRYIEKDL